MPLHAKCHLPIIDENVTIRDFVDGFRIIMYKGGIIETKGLMSKDKVVKDATHCTLLNIPLSSMARRTSGAP
jgi:hypothetical protein